MTVNLHRSSKAISTSDIAVELFAVKLIYCVVIAVHFVMDLLSCRIITVNVFQVASGNVLQL